MHPHERSQPLACWHVQMRGDATVDTYADMREVGPWVLMCTNKSTTPGLAEGTTGIESASGAERATAAQPEALGMMRPGTGMRWHRERCQPSAARLLQTVVRLGEGARGQFTAMKGEPDIDEKEKKNIIPNWIAHRPFLGRHKEPIEYPVAECTQPTIVAASDDSDIHTTHATKEAKCGASMTP